MSTALRPNYGLASVPSANDHEEPFPSPRQMKEATSERHHSPLWSLW